MSFDDSHSGTVDKDDLRRPGGVSENELRKAKSEGLLSDDDVELIKRLSNSMIVVDDTSCAGKLDEEGKTDENNAIRPADSHEEEPDSDEPMKFHDFFRVLLDKIKKVYDRTKEPDKGAYFTVHDISKISMEDLFKDGKLNKDGKLQTDHLLKWASSFNGEKVERVDLSFAHIPNGFARFEAKEFTIRKADEKFGLNRLLSKLEQYCDARLLPLAGRWDTEGVLRPQLNYVEVEEGMDELDNYHYMTQKDKAYAFVVAGESGSGKSVFSCLQVKHRFKYLPVYLLLDGKYRELAKPQSDFKELHIILRHMIDSFIQQNDGKGDVNKLFEIKRKLNARRNKWAVQVFESTLLDFATLPSETDVNKKSAKIDELRTDEFNHQGNINSWLEGDWNVDDKPGKVAIILDEATDIDLVEGIVEEIRNLKSKWQKRLARNDLMIVLTGTGLDSIRSPGRIGTNPACSRLVKLKGPNLKALEDSFFGDMVADDPTGFMAAVKHGLFSNVMRTNSRMFFRGVLPIFRSHFVVKDTRFVVEDTVKYSAEKEDKKNEIKEQERETKRQRYNERCKEVGSFGPIMDYAVRFYVDENWVGRLAAAERRFC